MSLRYISKQLYHAGVKGVQGMKDHASKCDTTVRTLRETASSSSSRQTRLFSGGLDSNAFRAAKNEKLKQSEESLRTVMFLSFWGPN